MRDFIENLKYLTSPSNSSSRGFYIFIAIMLVALLIAMPVMLVLFIVNTVKYGFAVLPLILFLVVVALFIGTIIWLQRS